MKALLIDTVSMNIPPDYEGKIVEITQNEDDRGVYHIENGCYILVDVWAESGFWYIIEYAPLDGERWRNWWKVTLKTCKNEIMYKFVFDKVDLNLKGD